MRKVKRKFCGTLVFFGVVVAGACFAQGNSLNTPVNQTASPENLTAITAAQPQTAEAPPVYAGEFFGMPVPLSNYYFVKYALSIFGNRQGPQPKTPQEIEGMVWDQLLLSYEAFRRNIEVPEEEVEREVAKLLEAEKVTFDWKNDQEAYEKWVKEKTNEPAVAFVNQIRHLLQIEKLRQKVMGDIKPKVEDGEAKQEFLNEYNTLSVELRQFDTSKEAQEFYKKARFNPKFWEEQKKLSEKEFKRPGFVSLIFLMDFWKFPKDGLYRMMKEPIGHIHEPESVYKGFGVFKILEKRIVSEKEFAKVKESYYNKVKRRKQYDGMNQWFKDLKRQAAIKVYLQPEKQSTQAAQGLAVNDSVPGEVNMAVTRENNKGGRQ